MTALAPALRPANSARLAGGVLVLALLAAGLVPVLSNAVATSFPMALAGCMALVAMALLAIARYDMAVGVGFLLMGVVFVEPAPPDGAFAVIMAVAAATGRFRIDRVPLIVLAFVSGLMVLNLLSMVDAVNTNETLRFFSITLYLAALGLWLAGYVDSERRARIVIVAWLVIGVASALAGALAFNLPIPGRNLFLGQGDTRAGALFKDPNVFGPFLVPLIVILLEQRIRPTILRLRGWVSAVLVVILVLGVLFSFSRASWGNLLLATTVMLAFSAARQTGGRRAFRLLVTLAATGLIAFVVLGMTGSGGFFEQRAQLQAYDTDRFAAQRAGYELGWEHPVGVGPGQFKFHHPVEAHSTYVRVLAEQGFVGLGLWLALAITTLVMAARNAVLGRDSFGIGSAALLGAWVGLLFNSAVVDTLHWRHLWVVAGLIWAGSAVTRRVSAR